MLTFKQTLYLTKDSKSEVCTHFAGVLNGRGVSVRWWGSTSITWRFFFLDKTRKIKKTKKRLTFPVCASTLFNATSAYRWNPLGGKDLGNDDWWNGQNAHLDGKTTLYHAPWSPKERKTPSHDFSASAGSQRSQLSPPVYLEGVIFQK